MLHSFEDTTYIIYAHTHAHASIVHVIRELLAAM